MFGPGPLTRLHWHFTLTIPHSLLSDRIGSGPVQVQRMTGEKYAEHNAQWVKALVDAGCVEGVATRTGKVLFLRLIVDDATVIQKLAEAEKKQFEKPGSITSGASKTSFEQHLESGHTCWCLSSLQDGWNRQSLSAFVAILLLVAILPMSNIVPPQCSPNCPWVL